MRFVDEPVVEATVDSQSVVAFDVTTPAGTTRVLLNLGPALPLPEDATVLVASGPLQDGTLPTDTAVWLAV